MRQIIIFELRVPQKVFLVKKGNMLPMLNTFVRMQPVAVNKMGDCKLSVVGVLDINWQSVRNRNIGFNGSKLHS
jgi:hypothetical protein